MLLTYSESNRILSCVKCIREAGSFAFSPLHEGPKHRDLAVRTSGEAFAGLGSLLQWSELEGTG